uniref:G-protein coupled receptors family 1 profile domain-containing protein n=1 Tax=Romanomermis culicivorax TaxID=13658 RepID=A0A915J860_ROMCU
MLLKFYRTPDQLNVWWCYLYQFLVSALPPLCHNVAIWLTVLLAVQRYIYVRYPLAAQNFCNVSNVRKCAIFLTLFSILSGCVRFFEFTFVKFDGFYVRLSTMDDQTSPTPDHVTELTVGSDRLFIHGQEVFCAAKHMSVVDWMTVPVFYNVYLWIRVLGFVLAPSIILIVINILLIMEIKQAKRRRERLTRAVVAQSSSEKNKREAQKQKETQNTNLMLIIIVTVFLITNLPQGTILAAISVNLTFNLRIEFFDTNYPNLIAMVDNMIILLSYPVNFAIYCSMSAQFRETFTRMFVNVPKSSISGLALVQNFVASYRRYSTPVTVSTRDKKSSRDFLAANNNSFGDNNNRSNRGGGGEEEETKTSNSEMSDKFRGYWSKRWTKEDQIIGATKNNTVNIRVEEENCAAKLCPIEQLPELADEEFL